MAIGKLRKAARIILVGPPGCGKGTQSGRLLDHFKLTPISSGDLLRQNVRPPPPYLLGYRFLLYSLICQLHFVEHTAYTLLQVRARTALGR